MNRTEEIVREWTKEEIIEKVREMCSLLLEARDALPAINMAAAKLRRIDLTLADRIERCLEPWRIEEDAQP